MGDIFTPHKGNIDLQFILEFAFLLLLNLELLDCLHVFHRTKSFLLSNLTLAIIRIK